MKAIKVNLKMLVVFAGKLLRNRMLQYASLKKASPLTSLVFLTFSIFVIDTTTHAYAQSSTVPPVQATYHGLKPHKGFSIPIKNYDAWTYGDIALYAPPGRVSQAAANQWLAWYARVDDMYRIITTRSDADFEKTFRANDPNFGRKKVIAFVEDSCGAGCGNKQQAETTLLDAALSDPFDITGQWIIFYEMGRGSTLEPFDYRANWPYDQVMMPHLMASLAYFDLGGMATLLREIRGSSSGTPANIWNDLDRWQAEGHQYVDYFPDKDQTFYEPGRFYPIIPSILLRIGVEKGLTTLSGVLRGIVNSPSSEQYTSATDAMCDFQEAVNQATNNEYANRLVNDWGMPACTGRFIPPSLATYENDYRNEGSGLCIELNSYAEVDLRQNYCSGVESQRLQAVAVEGGFQLRFENTNRCIEHSVDTGRVLHWTCDEVDRMTFTWDESRLRGKQTDYCITVEGERLNAAALFRMEPCNNSDFQLFYDGNIANQPPVTAEPSAPEAPTVPEAPLFPPEPLVAGEDLYTLLNEGSAKCLGVNDSVTTNGANVVQWDCLTGQNQLVKQIPSGDGFMLQFAHSGRCLDLSDVNILQWDCHGGANQLFQWIGAQLESLDNNMCVTVQDASSANGANIQTESCVDSPSQRFRKVDSDFDAIAANTVLDGASYLLSNLGSGKCIEVNGASPDAGTNVNQWECLNVDNQRVKQVNSSDAFMLQFAHSGKCLDLSDQNLLQWECHGQDNQLFNWDGFSLKSKDSGECIAITNSSSEDGANVQTLPCSSGVSQQFRPIEIDAPRLAAANSGSGCSIHTGQQSRIDPLFWLMFIVASGMFARRRIQSMARLVPGDL